MPLGPTIGSTSAAPGSDSDGIDHDGDGVIFDGTPNERAAPNRNAGRDQRAAKKQSDARSKARRDYLASKDSDKGPKSTQANQREERLDRAVARERLHGWEPSADGRRLKPAAGKRGPVGPAGPRNNRGAVNVEANSSRFASPNSRASSAENTNWAPGAADAPRGRGKSYDDPTLSIADLELLETLETKVYDPSLTVGEMEDLEFKGRRFGRIGGSIGMPHPRIGGRGGRGGHGGVGRGKRRLRPAAINLRAEDGDGDMLVQEGTTAERLITKKPGFDKPHPLISQLSGARDDSTMTTSRDKITPNKLTGMEMLHPMVQKRVQQSASKDAVRKMADNHQHSAIQRINAAKTRKQARKIADDFIAERKAKIAELNKKMHGDAGKRAMSATDADELASNIWQLHWMSEERSRLNGDRTNVGEIQRRAMSEKSQRLLESEDTHRAAEKRVRDLISKKVDQSAPKGEQISKINELRRREREDLNTSKRIAESSNDFHNITREEAIKELVIARLDTEMELRRTQERNMSARKILTGYGADEVQQSLKTEPKLNADHEVNGFVVMPGATVDMYDDYDGISGVGIDDHYIFLNEQREARGVTVRVTPKDGESRQGIIVGIDHGTDVIDDNGTIDGNGTSGAAWVWITHEGGKALEPSEQYWDLLPGDTEDRYEFHSSNRETRSIANYLMDAASASGGRKAGKKEGRMFSKGPISVEKDGGHSYMEIDRNKFMPTSGERSAVRSILMNAGIPRDMHGVIADTVFGKTPEGKRLIKEQRKMAEAAQSVDLVQKQLERQRKILATQVESLRNMDPSKRDAWARDSIAKTVARIHAMTQRIEDLHAEDYIKERASA